MEKEKKSPLFRRPESLNIRRELGYTVSLIGAEQPVREISISVKDPKT
jgi:hypothetical protein